MKNEKKLLNLSEVCELTGLSKSTIYKHTSERKLPHFKKAKHLYFDKEEIENWIRSGRVKTTCELEQEAF